MNTRKVCVLGLGYIGLPTAALLASRGYEVHGVDVVQFVVDTINRGEIHIIEPELDTFVRSAVNSGNLKASTKVEGSDIYIIAVPTPFHEGHIPNIDYVISATQAIAPFVKDGDIIILESTSPIGTTRKIEAELKKSNVNTDKIHLAHCPERVLPGKVMKELIENDRIVGSLNDTAAIIVKEFYETFVSGEVIVTEANTAEMCKLAENSFRDVNIAFANELSIICDKAKVDVRELIRLANRHPRVNILQPGAGVGGHCIAVDPWFLVNDFPEESKLIKQGRLSNEYKSEWVLEKIKNSALKFEINNGRKPKIACLGIAFKPDIDDLRESAALKIVNKLSVENLDIIVVEPNITNHPQLKLSSLKTALESADILVGLVAHKEFINLSHKNYLNFCS
jgi:UDP-N-acetyl-D-mannosaminuronic acid dehydrogenase